jgi:hypothetical protein
MYERRDCLQCLRSGYLRVDQSTEQDLGNSMHITRGLLVTTLLSSYRRLLFGDSLYLAVVLRALVSCMGGPGRATGETTHLPLIAPDNSHYSTNGNPSQRETLGHLSAAGASIANPHESFPGTNAIAQRSPYAFSAWTTHRVSSR